MNATLTEKDYEQMGKATCHTAANSLLKQLPLLKRKAADQKKNIAANRDNKTLQDAMKQAYQQKIERRNRLLKTNTAAKTKPDAKPESAKPTAANKNTGVNWHLINNLPHNLEADEATGTDPEANTPAWHIIENLDHNIEVDQK